jgi:crotonobetainyl-CoA:carnitine CoA-transferase CaiB-like acyl-CoA transferase
VRETGLIHWLEQAGLPRPVPVPALPGTPPPAPGTARAQAPTPGQHTAAILAEHGYAPQEIANLLAQGTVASAG